MTLMDRDSKILIVAPRKWGEKVRAILAEAGFSAVTLLASGNEAIRRKEWDMPDVVIAPHRLPDMLGVDLAEAFIGICMVVIVLSQETEAFPAQDFDNIVYMMAPVSAKMLVQTIDVVLQMDRRIESLSEKLAKVERSFQDHRTFDKVKAYMIERYGMSEGQAHRLLQKRSMESGRRMADLAKDILEEKIKF
jgi:AmiR/NasT family two-component response regulator